MNCTFSIFNAAKTTARACAETAGTDKNIESVDKNMNWFHDKCVGIKKSDSVGCWCCGGCRLMTANVSMLLQHFNTFTDSVWKQISQLFTNMNNRLQQLDDRITAHANQNKCVLEDITSSHSDIKSSLSN